MTQPAGRYSALGLAGLVLDHARLLLLVPLAALLFAVAFTLVWRGSYVAQASFTPQARQTEAGRLAGLASQFGLSLGGLAADGESVDFYARLARSRTVLEQVVLTEYRFARREGSADTLSGNLIALWKVRGDTPAEQLRKAVEKLERRLSVGLDLDANLVSVGTQARWPGLAEQINRALLQQIERFNLERRQSQASAERRFVEQQIARAQADLEAAEQELSTFLQHNRRYEDWPQLRFEAVRLQRRVDLRQQVYTTLAERLEQARVDEVRNTPVITIVDSPEGSADRDGRLVRNALLSTAFAFALVLAFLFLREYSERLRSEHPDDYRRLEERGRALRERGRTLLRRRRNGSARALRSLLPLAGPLPLAAPLAGAAMLLAALSMSACDDPFVAPEAPPIFTQVSTGGAHSCAVTETGSAYCWGRGRDGELGNGGHFDTAVPVRVATDQPLSEIGTGAAHTCALGVDGRAWCWGWNAYYQRGNAFDPADDVPVPVTGERVYQALAVGAHHACALTAGGQLFCWGYNRFGQVGDGTTNTAFQPVSVGGGRRFSQVSAGAWHTCAIGTDGLAYCWGRNDQSQLGVGSDTLQVTSPTPVGGGRSFTSISAGINHTCALAGAKVYCWGGNEHGQLGDGSLSKPGLTGAATPAPMFFDIAFERVAAGSYVSCGITPDSRALCWGRGAFGQVGSGEDHDHLHAQPVERHARGPLRVRDIAPAGDTHVCAISTQGALYCWGAGMQGQLGQDGETFALLPMRVRSAAEGIR